MYSTYQQPIVGQCQRSTSVHTSIHGVSTLLGFLTSFSVSVEVEGWGPATHGKGGGTMRPRLALLGGGPLYVEGASRADLMLITTACPPRLNDSPMAKRFSLR